MYWKLNESETFQYRTAISIIKTRKIDMQKIKRCQLEIMTQETKRKFKN